MRSFRSGWLGASGTKDRERVSLEEYSQCVKKLIKRFSEAGLDYAFTGALAVSFYGSPRTTSDVDVMVAVEEKEETRSKIATVLWKAGFEVEERRINDALTSGFNIATFKDKKTAYTVDIIFSGAKLDKQPATVAGVKTFLQSPEGLIASKLRMIKATVPRERAAKDEEDVRAILAFTKVDLAKVKKRSKAEKTLDILETFLK